MNEVVLINPDLLRLSNREANNLEKDLLPDLTSIIYEEAKCERYDTLDDALQLLFLYEDVNSRNSSSLNTKDSQIDFSLLSHLAKLAEKLIDTPGEYRIQL